MHIPVGHRPPNRDALHVVASVIVALIDLLVIAFVVVLVVSLVVVVMAVFRSFVPSQGQDTMIWHRSANGNAGRWPTGTN